MSIAISSISNADASTPAPAQKNLTETTPPLEGVVTSSRTQVTISSDSTDPDADAKALADFLTSGPGVMLKARSSADQWADINNEIQTFSVQPRETANRALLKVNSELTRIQGKIEFNRPSMLGKKWDFVLLDGKIQVVNDNLNAKDHQWLENVLNKNKGLVSAVSDFYGAVTKFYDHTSDHPRPTLRNAAGDERGFVYDAASQINGKLAIRDIMHKTIASLSGPNTFLAQDRRQPYFDSIALSRGYLQYEVMPKFHHPTLDTTDPVTAQYVKDHPGGWDY